MSGFAGFIHTDGGETRHETIEAIAAALAVRGPDATGVWTGEGVALVHALFRTTDEARHERQPLLPDDRFVFAGDVRLDAREELIATLAQAGSAAFPSSPDADLVLRAWLIWRDDCVGRLRGDFSFVVWDRTERRLFGARDHFGIRPFYYAPDSRAFVFGNMLAAVRRHPAVAVDPDDAAIVDTLVFRQFENPASTAFAAIRRLPGGHVLTYQAGRVETRRYWQGPADRPVRYRRQEEYPERYRELLTRAVSDRLRTNHVSVAMTGGLDSSSIAATAQRLLCSRGIRDGVEARTIVYDHLIPDRERHFAGLVAQMNGIPIAFASADDRPIYERASEPSLQPPEPVDDPFRAMLTDFYRSIASRGRVLLMGLDGDTFLCEIASDYLLARLRRGEFAEYARGVVSYVRTRRELPPHRLRTTLRYLLRRSGRRLDAWPDWIAPAMVERFDVAARWAARPAAQHRLVRGWPLRVRAASVLASPIWSTMFDRHDAEHLGAPIEARFPFADLELVEFLLNIPAVPWCIDKYIARQAMADRLPREVLTRPKSPMAGDTVRARIRLGDRLPWTETFRAHPLLPRYVDVSVLTRKNRRHSAAVDASADTRAFMLNEWLWYHLPLS